LFLRLGTLPAQLLLARELLYRDGDGDERSRVVDSFYVTVGCGGYGSEAVRVHNY
jgi:hypothetical protein